MSWAIISYNWVAIFLRSQGTTGRESKKEQKPDLDIRPVQKLSCLVVASANKMPLVSPQHRGHF